MVSIHLHVKYWRAQVKVYFNLATPSAVCDPVEGPNLGAHWKCRFSDCTLDLLGQNPHFKKTSSNICVSHIMHLSLYFKSRSPGKKVSCSKSGLGQTSGEFSLMTTVWLNDCTSLGLWKIRRKKDSSRTVFFKFSCTLGSPGILKNTLPNSQL